MVDPRVMDPGQELISLQDFSEEEVEEIVEVMEAMRRWRKVERELNEASRKFMQLGENDMRAVRYIIACQRHGELATPSDVAKYLGITTASVSRMIDRLVEATIRAAPRRGMKFAARRFSTTASPVIVYSRMLLPYLGSRPNVFWHQV